MFQHLHWHQFYCWADMNEKNYVNETFWFIKNWIWKYLCCCCCFSWVECAFVHFIRYTNHLRILFESRCSIEIDSIFCRILYNRIESHSILCQKERDNLWSWSYRESMYMFSTKNVCDESAMSVTFVDLMNLLYSVQLLCKATSIRGDGKEQKRRKVSLFLSQEHVVYHIMC